MNDEDEEVLETDEEKITTRGVLVATISKLFFGLFCVSIVFITKDIDFIGTTFRWLVYIGFSFLFLFDLFFLLIAFVGSIFTDNDEKSLGHWLVDKVIESMMLCTSAITIGLSYSIGHGLDLLDFSASGYPWLSGLLLALIGFSVLTMIPFVRYSLSGRVSEEGREKNFLNFVDAAKNKLNIDLSNIADSYEVRPFIQEKYRDNFLTFDCECISEDEDYQNFVHQYCSITDGALVATDVESKIDWDSEEAYVSANINGKRLSLEFDQDSDWFSDDFHKEMKKLSIKLTNGEFLLFPTEDQCAEIIFLNKKEADVFKKYGYLY